MSNGASFLGRYLSSIYIPIANNIGLNTTWNFFSPDPAHTMYFKYYVYKNDDSGDLSIDSEEHYFPENIKDHNFRMDQRRLSYVMRFLALDQNRIESIFIPWVCKNNPKATHVRTEVELYRIPTLEVVQTLGPDFLNQIPAEEINPVMHECKNSI